METNIITNMTLDEWLKLTSETAIPGLRGARMVMSQLGAKWDDRQSCAHRQLWRLKDYYVSSYSSGIAWLMPR